MERVKPVKSWMEKSKEEIENEEEFLICRLIILQIVKCMKEHKLSIYVLSCIFGITEEDTKQMLNCKSAYLNIDTLLRYAAQLSIDCENMLFNKVKS